MPSLNIKASSLLIFQKCCKAYQLGQFLGYRVKTKFSENNYHVLSCEQNLGLIKLNRISCLNYYCLLRNAARRLEVYIDHCGHQSSVMLNILVSLAVNKDIHI